MSKTIHRRQKARQDLVDTFRYHAREAGFRVAQRFLAQAEATFTRLARMPGTGTLGRWVGLKLCCRSR